MFWELILQNRRKSLWLFAIMAVVLVVLGFVIGSVFDAERGGIAGIILAMGIWVFLTLLTLSNGDEILLKVSGAHEITKDVHPRLFNVVEEMKIAAGLPAMPKVYIIDEPAPNAFAIGLKPEKSAVAVTAGLLERLDRDELQGVVAHEMSHVMNRDSQLMTVAGIMLGSIVLVSQVFLRSLWFWPSGSRRYRRSGGGSPQLQLIMIAVAVVLAILAPIFARLLYLAISRKREYLADASAVQLTRYPSGLASALEKISSVDIQLEAANQVTAPMYIVNPLVKKGSKLSDLSSTHPPITRRIKILRSMTSGADIGSYQKAFSRVHRKSTPLIPTSGLRKSKHIDIREATPEDKNAKDDKKTQRDVMDLMRAVNDYAFMVCVCGLKMKLPPELSEDETVSCPRCGRGNKIPVAELETIGAVVGVSVGPRATAQGDTESGSRSRELEYVRKGRGWETFACACGRLLQLSPAFSGQELRCKSCGKRVRIKY
ncbi:MAG: M48 family metallopeptidase [Candidatus Krumholzibacteria bacterium]|nr:M48 family metallopeptidase [Candidatus Krumholzibacteria bacterium]